MIVISDKTVALWSVKLDDDAELLMGLEEVSAGLFELRSRIQVHNPENSDPWSGGDEKRWLCHRIACSRDNAVERCRALMQRVEDETGNKADEVTGENEKAIIEELLKRPWCHAKKLEAV